MPEIKRQDIKSKAPAELVSFAEEHGVENASTMRREELMFATIRQMDAKLQKRVQRYGWDKAASHYERSWQVQLEPAQTALLDMANPVPGEKILDVACGTGLVTFRAAAAVAPEGEVIGADISEQMIATARELAQVEAITNVTFERMDAEALAVEGGSFDVVLCALGLMYAPDPERAVAEMHRALKPGGRAVSAVWDERRGCGWADIFPIVDARVHSEVCPMFFSHRNGRLPAACVRLGRVYPYRRTTPADDARLRHGRRGMRGGFRRRARGAGL
jgi:ubiquinone/menaquinone biosynthesis C-methylase UbiE